MRPFSPARRLKAFAVGILPAVFMLPVAYAQTPPDAGALQREAERARTAPAVPALPAPPAPMKVEAKGATVTVKSFRIEGASRFSAAELAGLLADQVGKTLTLAELEQTARRIAAHYRERGWFARAYLPEQDITAGVIVIQVIEGRFGGARIERDGSRADADFAARIAAARLAPGEPLSAADLERGLLLANDLPGIKTAGILEAGDTPGETRLTLKVADGPYVGGDAALNNHGTRSTGQEQINANFYLNPGDGSQWRLNVLAAEKLASLRAQYALPIGADGLRANLHLSDLRYRLGGDFANLDASGDAQSAGAALNYPLIRSEAANLNLNGAIEHRRYADDSMGVAQRRKQADAFTLSAGGDRTDGWGGGGLTQGSLAIALGTVDLSGVAADLVADQAGPRANGRYAKLSGQVVRLQRVAESISLHTALSAQWADKNLDSSEKFALGGPYGVRAYPVSEASGDAGWLLNLELRKELADGWRAFGFVDGGEIRQHSNPWAGWDAGSGQPNSYSLMGAGFGIAWNRPGDIALQLTLATPVGNHPGKTATGKNQDGSTSEARAWLRIAKYF
ncbi:MAG: ShlB/FhaC/HecB family hemolysin secretion/activation protein [Gallionella sp.]